jgi:hypothetical protein
MEAMVSPPTRSPPSLRTSVPSVTSVRRFPFDVRLAQKPKRRLPRKLKYILIACFIFIQKVDRVR